jgi:transcriptional regulator with XRE-family HTH domain
MGDPVPMLAQRMRELRDRAGISQQALAMAAGLSISVVAQIEQGQRPDPRLSTAVALARALGVALDELVADPGTAAEAIELPEPQRKPHRHKRPKPRGQ